MRLILDMTSTTFVERMRLIANDTALVQRTYQEEYEKNKELRKDQLFRQLTFKYYDKIKLAIENASKHGRQYVYMNFEYNDFKPNFNGLGTPAQFQRLWLTEMCNPNSKYLILPNWQTTSVFGITTQPVEKRDSFEGLHFDVWNNGKFTTVFSWDTDVNTENMDKYYTRSRIPTWSDYPND